MDEEEQKEAYLLVMNAPTSNFGMKQMESFSNIMPKITDQIIVFINDKDGPILMDKMSEKIGAKWSIIKEDTYHSIIRRKYCNMADKNLFLKNYSFYGKHADMVDAIIGKIDEDSGTSIFSIVIDLFIMSAIVGVKNNHKSKPDSDKTRDKKILAEQFNSHSHDVKTAFKFVTLIGNKEKFD